MPMDLLDAGSAEHSVSVFIEKEINRKLKHVGLVENMGCGGLTIKTR